MGRGSKRQTGASAVEFAIILPILLVLIFGIIEFGFAIYDKTMITNACREGARAGIVYRDPRVTDEEIASVVNHYLSNYLITFGGSNSATVTVTRTGYHSGDELKVRVAYTYTSLILPDLIQTLGREFNMVAETTMRME
ncbi:MAG: TadE/TadG family type IV pilus assembly protein [Thermodesulfobacteriota bacterium]